MIASYHCELAWLGGDRPEADVLVTVEGDHITGVTVGAAADGATRLAGLTVPGFANAHSHAFHRALRGRTHDGAGSFWTWRQQMYELARRLDPDSYFRLARATYAEMALAGISTVGEFHYLHHAPNGAPYGSPNAMGEALIAAAREAGMRITLLDTCYLRGGAGVQLDEAQRRFSDGDVGAWAARAGELRDTDGVRIGAAVHSARAVDRPSIAAIAHWAAERGCVLHAHVSEQPAENEWCVGEHGLTPTELLADAGALDQAFTAVHAVHVTDHDVQLLGGHRSWCCLCPTTERDLADGIASASLLRAAGVEVTLGSDSHAVIDLLEEARAVELDERLATGTRGHHDAVSLLAMATTNGHASLGWPGAGRIERGAPADLTTILLDSVRTAGATHDTALGTVVFAATAADVHHVVIGGRVVVADGRHATIDVEAELQAVLG